MVGTYNYYEKCDKKAGLSRLVYILKFSCAKTIARRRKDTMSHVFTDLGSLLTTKTTIYNSENKPTVKYINLPSLSYLSKKQSSPAKGIVPFDPFASFGTQNKIFSRWRTKFKVYRYCCICGSPDDIGYHHTNSLGRIKAGLRS
jgi:hypothetical protein